jgi:hypothetical protein
MILLYLGFLMPVGKLIILEALAVIQITYFSIQQLKQIPMTFYGFKSLTYSNGYNLQDYYSPNSG